MPSPIEHKGKRYRIVCGSDVDRDGMYLELWDSATEENQLYEAFYSDATGEMHFTSLSKENVPFEIVEEFLQRARFLLTPMKNEEGE